MCFNKLALLNEEQHYIIIVDTMSCNQLIVL